jgi:pimeloyl-ACP methyl ester carboxylesterase
MNGFRAIAPHLRGFGRSERPEGVAAYSLQNAVGDVVGILEAFGIDAADIVGHDWGAAVAWFTATAHPDRVHKLVVLSVPHPLAPRTPRLREMAWYQLFFQFEGIAEAWLQHDVGLWIWSTMRSSAFCSVAPNTQLQLTPRFAAIKRALSSSLPRASRDITVPIGISSVLAISL